MQGGNGQSSAESKEGNMLISTIKVESFVYPKTYSILFSAFRLRSESFKQIFGVLQVTFCVVQRLFGRSLLLLM
jgi:hypothetical protein